MVEECQKIRIDDLLKRYRLQLKEMIIKSELEAMGWNIELATSKTHYGGTRIWFKCPLCMARVGVLFKHPLTDTLGCRRCLNLEYQKRRYKGMVENENL